MEQGRNSRDTKSKGANAKTDPSAVAKDTIAQIAIFVDVLVLFIFQFFGQGEEVVVGIGVNAKTYYTAGYDDIGFWLLGAVIISVVALAVIGILNRK